MDKLSPKFDGYRHLTPEMQAWWQRAEDEWSGLPAGVSHHTILATFKRWAAAMQVDIRLVGWIDYLFSHTWPQDWEAESRPIVWPGNERIADTMSVTKPAVPKALRRLYHRGLIVIRDQASGNRRGSRDEKNRIILKKTFGIDLSILAVRYEEFLADIERAEAERDERRQIRSQIGAVKKSTIELCAMVERAGGRAELDEMVGVINAIWADARRQYPENPLPYLLEVLLRHRETVEGWVHEAIETEKKTVTPELSTGPIEHTKPSHQDFEKVQAARAVNQAPVDNFPSDDRMREFCDDKGTVLAIVTPLELLRMAPMLAEYVPQSRPTWRDLTAAGRSLAHRMGVSAPLWESALKTCGPESAVVALAVVSAKEVGEVTGTWGRYFWGMVKAAKNRELHLGPTVNYLRYRTRTNPINLGEPRVFG